MAKPIRATPSLIKEEAKEFVKNMLQVEKRTPNKSEKEIIKAISC